MSGLVLNSYLLSDPFQSKDRWRLDVGLEDLQSPKHIFTAEGFFLFSGQHGISHHTGNALASQYSVDTDHLGDIRDGCDLNNGDSCFLNAGCDRCAATSA